MNQPAMGVPPFMEPPFFNTYIHLQCSRHGLFSGIVVQVESATQALSKLSGDTKNFDHGTHKIKINYLE